MNPTIERKDPANLPWVPSPTKVPGCFGKKLFQYGQEGLGKDGRAESYTTLYRFDPGASYPSWRMIDGVCEIWVLTGTLQVNDERVEAGEWVRLGPNSEGWSLGSSDGCEVLGIVRGQIELIRST